MYMMNEIEFLEKLAKRIDQLGLLVPSIRELIKSRTESLEAVNSEVDLAKFATNDHLDDTLKDFAMRIQSAIHNIVDSSIKNAVYGLDKQLLGIKERIEIVENSLLKPPINNGDNEIIGDNGCGTEFYKKDIETTLHYYKAGTLHTFIIGEHCCDVSFLADHGRSPLFKTKKELLQYLIDKEN